MPISLSTLVLHANFLEQAVQLNRFFFAGELCKVVISHVTFFVSLSFLNANVLSLQRTVYLNAQRLAFISVETTVWRDQYY